ncbi:efflux RND transporter periplasmic adaptor subunit [Aquihabitans sp. McL0605]|uniref:efflux RND transporter periplasmic adaptor subunit n=1 Tax=Aquihabitans sp. McL0605 TaxID=3415671 RepID=UPI003CF57B44
MRSLAQQMKKPWVVMPLVALLALGGWFAFRPDDDASAQNTATDRVVTATEGTMAKTVSADGTVAAAKTEDLNFSAAGTVTAVNVKAGDEVKAGDVLAEIDSAALQADVSSAESTLADAQAKLSDDEDASASDAQIEADQSSLTSAQDQLDAANEALDGAKLVATIDGTVASVGVTTGEELSSGGSGGTDQTGSASGSGNSASSLPASGGTTGSTGSTGSGSDTTSAADISLVSTGSFTVDLGFGATDIANIKPGQAASVTISTSSSSSSRGGFGGGFGGFGGFGPQQQQQGSTTTTAASSAGSQTSAAGGSSGGVTGGVLTVGTVADASSGVASYPVTIGFSDTTGAFNVGADVTVAITYAQVDDAVQVPAFAVTTNTDGTSSVKVQTSSGTETRTVTTGLTSGTMVQITDGLKAGESVVIELPGRLGGTGGGNAPTGGPALTPGGGS